MAVIGFVLRYRMTTTASLCGRHWSELNSFDLSTYLTSLDDIICMPSDEQVPVSAHTFTVTLSEQRPQLVVQDDRTSVADGGTKTMSSVHMLLDDEVPWSEGDNLIGSCELDDCLLQLTSHPGFYGNDDTVVADWQPQVSAVSLLAVQSQQSHSDVMATSTLLGINEHCRTRTSRPANNYYSDKGAASFKTF